MRQYSPGDRNISGDKRKKRKHVAYFGLFLGFLIVFLLSYFDLPRIHYLFVFLAFMGGFEGYLQYREGFDSTYSVVGTTSPEKLEGRQDIQAIDYRKQNVMKALKIHAYAGTIAAILTVVVYYVVP